MQKDFERHLIRPGETPRLAEVDPADTGDWTKKAARKRLEEIKEQLHSLHELLLAERKHGVLVVLQGLDASGKDGVIKHVADAFNHIACYATAFKVPTKAELAHDFLWRVHAVTPGRGEVALFNRSHYEDVLVQRVDNIVPESVWSKRYDAINNFEQLLVDNGILVLKFMLHISPDEQAERMDSRLADATKHWKFRVDDLATRNKWDAYMAAYDDAIHRCSTLYAPWYVIPADKKWYRNLAIAEVLLAKMRGLEMRWPPLEKAAEGMTTIADYRPIASD